MYPQATDNKRESIVIRLSEIVVYPESRTKFLADKDTGNILLSMMENEETAYAVGLTMKSGAPLSEMSEETLYRTGNLLEIRSIMPADEGYLVSARSVQRVKAVSLYQKDRMFFATYEEVPDINDLDEELQEEIVKDIKRTIHEISERFKSSEAFTKPIDNMTSVDQIMGYVMPFISIGLADKQDLLETTSVRERYLAFMYILTNQKENIDVRMEVAKKVAENVSRSHREAMLREQLKVIQEELHEFDDPVSGEDNYRDRIEASGMPEDVKKKALSELKKLETGGHNNPENHVIRNYLDLLLDLPWEVTEKKSIDIEQAREVLESNHNGLEKVKERIIQHLAVMKLKHEKQGSILLFTGPPEPGRQVLAEALQMPLEGNMYV